LFCYFFFLLNISYLTFSRKISLFNSHKFPHFILIDIAIGDIDVILTLCAAIKRKKGVGFRRQYKWSNEERDSNGNDFNSGKVIVTFDPFSAKKSKSKGILISRVSPSSFPYNFSISLTCGIVSCRACPTFGISRFKEVFQ